MHPKVQAGFIRNMEDWKVVFLFSGLLVAGCTGLSGANGPQDDGGQGGSDTQQTGRWGPPASPSEVSRRLSRLLWGEDAIQPEIAAQLGATVVGAQTSKVAKTMLEDGRSRKGIGEFFSWLLLLSDLSSWRKPAGFLTPELRASMASESPAFASHVVFDGNGTFEELFLADYTFADETLANHYGINDIVGSELRRTPFGTDARRGLLGQASVLTRFSGPDEPTFPMRRAGLLGRVLNCSLGVPYASFGLPPSPVTVALDPSQLIREQSIDMTAPEHCQVCHGVVNPSGFPFMRFDTIGRYRVNDAGGPIDTIGAIPASWNGASAFESDIVAADQPDLVRKLAELPSSRRCLARRWLHYIRGLDPQFLAEDDPMIVASLDQAHRAFEESGQKIVGLLLALVETPTFLSVW